MISVPFNPTKTDLRGIRFTQSVTGHVHSPWFTYDYSGDLNSDGQINYGYGQWARVIDASKSAFASVLGINGSPGRDVIVTEREDHDKRTMKVEKMWRLSTKNPCKLPSSNSAPSLASGAIDVETKKLK